MLFLVRQSCTNKLQYCISRIFIYTSTPRRKWEQFFGIMYHLALKWRKWSSGAEMFPTCSTDTRISNCLPKRAAAYLPPAEELINELSLVVKTLEPSSSLSISFPWSLTFFCLCRGVTGGSPTGIYRPGGTQMLRAGIALILFLLFRTKEKETSVIISF